MSQIKEFYILDLFCGAGGFSYGMHKNSHFKTVVAIDFNEKAANDILESHNAKKMVYMHI